MRNSELFRFKLELTNRNKNGSIVNIKIVITLNNQVIFGGLLKCH